MTTANVVWFVGKERGGGGLPIVGSPSTTQQVEQGRVVPTRAASLLRGRWRAPLRWRTHGQPACQLSSDTGLLLQVLQQLLLAHLLLKNVPQVWRLVRLEPLLLLLLLLKLLCLVGDHPLPLQHALLLLGRLVLQLLGLRCLQRLLQLLDLQQVLLALSFQLREPVGLLLGDGGCLRPWVARGRALGRRGTWGWGP